MFGSKKTRALGHQRQLRIGHLAAVRHGRASGERGRTDRRGAVRVHPRSQPDRLGLPARRLDLLVGHRLRTALAAALRREQLHEIRAVGFEFLDERADLIGRAGVFVDRTDRRQQPRSRQDAARDRRADLHVERRAEALHGGEAGGQRGVGVFGLVHGRLRRRLAAGRRAAVGTEMGIEVHVRVDQARKDRDVAQVVGRTRAPGCDSSR